MGRKIEEKKIKLWRCSTFDIEGLFHKESHNSYSHFRVQIYGAILAVASRGRKCGEASLLLRLCGFRGVVTHLSPANTISSAWEREDSIFSFLIIFP